MGINERIQNSVLFFIDSLKKRCTFVSLWIITLRRLIQETWRIIMELSQEENKYKQNIFKNKFFTKKTVK